MDIKNLKEIKFKQEENRVKRLMNFTMLFVLALSLLFGTGIKATAAETNQIPPIIYVEKYEITNERIIPGESFALSITVKNYSNSVNATDVQVTVQNPYGVAPVYGTVSQLYVGTINAGEEQTVSFEYDSWNTIKSDTLDFQVAVSARNAYNSFTLRVPSSADIPFSLMTYNIPTEAQEGEYSSASITFKVLGEENVSDVVLKVMCNGEIIGSSQAGSITAGTTKTQSTTFMLHEFGNHTIDFYLDYVSSDGEKESAMISSQPISVVKAVDSTNNFEQVPSEETENVNNNLFILGVGGILILAIFLLVVIIIRKQR